VPPERAPRSGLARAAAGGAGVPPGESVARAAVPGDALSIAASSMAVVAWAAAFLAHLMP
jgi:hypothetical protein